MPSESAVKKVIANIERSAFSDAGGYLDYNSPVGKSVFANWPVHAPPTPLSEYQRTASYVESYDRHLRKRIATYDSRNFLPIKK